MSRAPPLLCPGDAAAIRFLTCLGKPRKRCSSTCSEPSSTDAPASFAKRAASPRAHGLSWDWFAFADAWRAGYRRRNGSGAARPMAVDQDRRAASSDIGDPRRLPAAPSPRGAKRELNTAWHRLKPWPDALRGLSRLKHRYCIATLSSGNVGLRVDMALHARLPWDCLSFARALPLLQARSRGLSGRHGPARPRASRANVLRGAQGRPHCARADAHCRAPSGGGRGCTVGRPGPISPTILAQR